MKIRQVRVGNEIVYYTLTRRKTKRIILRVRQGGEVTVTASYMVPIYIIEEFIVSKYDWIKKSCEKSVSEERKKGSGLRIFGEEVKVKIDYGDCRSVVFKNGEITINVYKNDEISNIQAIFDKWYNNFACEYLEEASIEVYQRLFSGKIPMAEVKLRFMSSRWGSCYYNKNMIVLNKHLIQLKKHLIEQVIIHEYSHFFHNNHSKQFKTFMRELNPNSDEFEKILRIIRQSDTIIEKIM